MNPSGRNVISFSLLYHCKRTFTRSKRARYNTIPRMLLPIYCPQTKLREGNVFTPVCHSVCKGGGCVALGPGGMPLGPGGVPPLPGHTHPHGHTSHWTPPPPTQPHFTLDTQPPGPTQPPGHPPLDTPPGLTPFPLTINMRAVRILLECFLVF